MTSAMTCLSYSIKPLSTGGSDGKESASSERDPGQIPTLERYPREGNGNPF